MLARLLFFGKLADAAGARTRELSLNDDELSIVELIARIGVMGKRPRTASCRPLGSICGERRNGYR